MSTMLGTDLVRKLRTSGTGPRKLDVALNFLQTNPTASAVDTYNELRRHAVQSRDVGFQGTLEKAGQIIESGTWENKSSAPMAPEDQIAAIAAGRMAKPEAPPPATFEIPSLEKVKETNENVELRAIVNRLLGEVAALKDERAAAPPLAPSAEVKAMDVAPPGSEVPTLPAKEPAPKAVEQPKPSAKK